MKKYGTFDFAKSAAGSREITAILATFQET
jgi:hypothetical protein